MPDLQPRRQPRSPVLLAVIVIAFAVIAAVSGFIVRNFNASDRAEKPGTAESTKQTTPP